MPGKTSQIKVGYDTTLVGPFTKIIEVYSNDSANSRSVINIKGSIEGPANAATARALETKAEVKSVDATSRKVARKAQAL